MVRRVVDTKSVVNEQIFMWNALFARLHVQIRDERIDEQNLSYEIRYTYVHTYHLRIRPIT